MIACSNGCKCWIQRRRGRFKLHNAIELGRIQVRRHAQAVVDFADGLTERKHRDVAELHHSSRREANGLKLLVVELEVVNGEVLFS